MDKPQVLAVACCILYCLSAGMLEATSCWQKPYCSCTGKDEKQAIYCSNVRDISDVVELFKNHTPVYRIRLRGTYTTIPSKAFDGISVTFLALMSPLALDIPPDALLGIQNLKIVSLNTTLYQKIPEVFSNQNYVKFDSTYGRLVIIGSELQNMSLATEIRLSRNLISSVDPDAFYGTNNVEVLDLSHNNLVYLHPETLKSVRSLKEIFLQHNNLHKLDGCLQNINPKMINLYGNNLTNIDNVLHRGMWNLEYLNIGGNPKIQISALDFNSSMKSLTQLHLSNNGLTQLDSYLLKNVWKLNDLYLNGNDLTFIPKYFFENNPFINVLQLSNNRLKSVEESMVHRREWYNTLQMTLDGNELKTIAFGKKPLLIMDLDISRNQIRSIKAEDMVALQKLKSLNLSSNGLRFLESESFDKFNFLIDLDLSNNHLTRLNSSLQELSMVRHLDISSSFLEYLSEDEFIGMQSIKSIRMGNNNLQSVRGLFRKMKYITHVDVSMNNLTTMTVESFPPFQRTSIRVTRLLMAGNPWSCDCRLAWMAKWVRRQGSTLADEPVCFSPDHLKNQTLRSLNQTDYERWLDGCPEECDCICRAEGERVYTEAHCTGRGLSEVPKVLPPNVRSVDLRGNAIESFDGNDVLGLKNLERLNLERNKIDKIHVLLPPKMSSLRLAGNHLRSFPLDQWVAANVSVGEISLSRNPWTCNCDTWPFRNWLIQHNDSVVDVDVVRCGEEESFILRDKPIISLTREDLCSKFSSIVFLSVSSVVLVMVCLFTFCFRHSLAALWYSWGCTCLKRAETHDYPYDAFLMYSADDEDLALGDLATGLESRIHRFNLCIPTRDIPSPRTPQKINAYLPQCTKVIVLLSRAFIDSRDCMRFLISAMSFSTESSARSIIFVTLGELPSSQELDPILKTLLRSCKRFRWGQRLFWQKLVYQLPKKAAKTDEYHDVEEEPFLKS